MDLLLLQHLPQVFHQRRPRRRPCGELLNRMVGGINVFRSIYYIPVLVPPVASSLLWVWIFDPQIGVLNFLLNLPAAPVLLDHSLRPG